MRTRLYERQNGVFMKVLKQIPILVTVLLVIVFVAGCSGMKLDRPTELTIDVDRSVPLLSWKGVSDATYYKLSITAKGVDGKPDSERVVNVAKTQYSLLSIDGGEYVFKVKALDAKGNYLASDWSEGLKYTMLPSNGLVYTLTNANTEYVVTGIGTARGDVVIGDEYRGKPVTAIADRAFYAKSALTGITISSNIKTIGRYAFTGCSNLRTVTIEGNVQSIGDYAFQSCSALENIVLPDSVTEIGNYTFRYCRHLKSITLGQNTTTIGQEAFMQCTQLSDIALPDSLTYIGQSAFGYCESLTEVTLGKGVTEIGKSAFMSAINLEKVNLNDGLKVIGEGAFEKCEKIASVKIPDSVTTISDSAFYDCKALFDVTLGSGITSIGRYAFQNSNMYAKSENGVYYVGKWAFDTDKEVCKTQKEAGVRYAVKEGTVGIADSAFRSRTYSELYLPDSVVYIGQSAFRSCSSLMRVELGANVKILGESAFRDCTLLGRNKINLGNKLEKIDNYVFANCSDFGNPTYLELFYKDFSLPSTLKSIGTYAFLNSGFWTKSKTPEIYVGKWLVGYKVSAEDTEQRAVYVKDGTIGISNYAFYKKNLVTTVTIPESVKYIGMAAFAQCENLQIVNIDMFCELEEIPDYAFYKCTSLFEVSVPPTIKRIGRSAFYKSGLMVANVAEDVESIGDYAFYGCESIVKVNFEGNNPKLQSIGNYAFTGVSKLESISLPDNVTTIGKSAFSKCTSLKNVHLGTKLESLGSGAFASCTSLEKIVLPETLKTIEERTFYKCSALSSVKMLGVQQISDYAFYRCGALKTIDLPQSLTSIGNYAFFRCSLTDLYISDNVTFVGAHAFNGNTSLTLYLKASQTTDWNARWNSAFRPVVLGCQVASDDNGTYIVSFTKNQQTLLNFKSVEGSTSFKYSDPTRTGYTFGGWTTTGEQPVVYRTDSLDTVPDNTELIAIWNKLD